MTGPPGAPSWQAIPSGDLRSLLRGMVGSDFGEAPETRLAEIRESRRAYARKFARMARLRESDTVLDLGSGCGFGTSWLAEHAREVIAFDVSDAYLEHARRECAAHSNVRFVTGEPGDLGAIGEASADCAVALSVFIHLNLYDVYHCFRQLRRILRPGGRVVLDYADMDALDFARNGPLERCFLEAEALYRSGEVALPGLMNWNTGRAVVQCARAHGFRPTSRRKHVLALRRQS